MAMNKQEKAELEALKKELLLNAALRWTEKVETDVPIPTHDVSFGTLSKGFLHVAAMGDSPRVELACSSTINHSTGRNDKTTTQGARRLYSTRLLALKALRNEVEQHCAKKLAEIDKDIYEEKNSNGNQG